MPMPSRSPLPARFERTSLASQSAELRHSLAVLASSCHPACCLMTDWRLVHPAGKANSNQDASDINPFHEDFSGDFHHQGLSWFLASPKGVNCHQKAPAEAGARNMP